MMRIYGLIPLNKKEGFTLLEVMIAVFIFTIIMSVVGTVLNSTINITNKNNEITREKTALRQAHLLIEKELNTSNTDLTYSFSKSNQIILIDSTKKEVVVIKVLNNDLIVNENIILSGVSELKVFPNHDNTMFEVVLRGINSDFKISKMYLNNRFKR